MTRARDALDALIERFLDDGLSVGELAKLLGLEPAQLYHEIGESRAKRAADKAARVHRAATRKAAWARATVLERQQWRAGELTTVEIEAIAQRPPPPVGRKPPGRGNKRRAKDGAK